MNINTKWKQDGITVVGGNGQGSGLNQLNSPHGIYVNDDQSIYIADENNHHVVEWKSGAANGQVIAGGKGEGNGPDQLNGPKDVIVNKNNDSLFISDCWNERVVRCSRRNGANGETIIADICCWGLGMDNNENLKLQNFKLIVTEFV